MLNPREYVRARLQETRPRFAFDAWQQDNPDTEVSQWQMLLRAELARCIGIAGWERVPLKAQTDAPVQLDGYQRERVTFQSRSGLTVMGYYLVPDGIQSDERRPAFLCLPGHGPGVDDLVGIREDGTQRALNAPESYSADFALQCVAHGYPTLAIEQISFGHRRDEEAKKAGAGASSCVRDSMAALMLGETMIGWRVWDAIVAVDFLQTRSEVNGEQIGVMGISGGGLTALFAAALDTRIYGAMVSGYLNTFDGSVLAVNHCPDNYAPGLRSLCEMSDIAGLVAPRPLFAENGTDDPIFPLAQFEKAKTDVTAIYQTVNAAERFSTHVFSAGHEFNGAPFWSSWKRVHH
jgi:dienelactone hydrolase